MIYNVQKIVALIGIFLFSFILFLFGLWEQRKEKRRRERRK